MSIPDGAEQSPRISPVIWAAKAELDTRGWHSEPLRISRSIPIDLIAWNDRKILFVLVRRVRRPPTVSDINTRYGPLFERLRVMARPCIGDIELWIAYQGSFVIYTVLAGGIMQTRSRS